MLSDIPVRLDAYWQALQPQGQLPPALREHGMVELNGWGVGFTPTPDSQEHSVLSGLKLALSADRPSHITTMFSSSTQGAWDRGTHFAVISCPPHEAGSLGCEIVAMRSKLKRQHLGRNVPEGDGLIGGLLGTLVVGTARGDVVVQEPFLGFRLRMTRDDDIDQRPREVRAFWGAARRLLGAS